MIEINPILLGIDGLSYSSFMKCNPRTLFTLFSSTYRGVVSNKKPQDPKSSWLSVLEMIEIKDNNFPINDKPKLIKETDSIPINIPITNPTYGNVSIPYDYSLPAEEEIDKVLKAILESVESKPVIASITAIDRILHRDNSSKCKIYELVDNAVRKIVHKVDDYIIFSIYGEPKSENENDHEEYGVFLATISRPSEHDVVKLPEIGILFKKLVNKEYY